MMSSIFFLAALHLASGSLQLGRILGEQASGQLHRRFTVNQGELDPNATIDFGIGIHAQSLLHSAVMEGLGGIAHLEEQVNPVSK